MPPDARVGHDTKNWREMRDSLVCRAKDSIRLLREEISNTIQVCQAEQIFRQALHTQRMLHFPGSPVPSEQQADRCGIHGFDLRKIDLEIFVGQMFQSGFE
jgi:hypothetical protein